MNALSKDTLDTLTEHLAALVEDAQQWPKPCRNITEAALRGEMETVREFLDNGANIEERTIGFTSPLTAAAGRGQMAVVDLLIERGASLDPADSFFPILQFPIMHKRYAAITRLLQAGASKEKHLQLFRHMGKEGNWEVVDAMVRGGMDPAKLLPAQRERLEAWQSEHPGGVPDPPLPKAALDQKAKTLSAEERAAHERAVGALIAACGPELANAKTPSGTPLINLAAEARSVEIVRAFLDAGASPNIAASGLSPLMHAAQAADFGLVQLLLGRGADPCLQNTRKSTALIAAASSGSLACVQLLLEHGADPRPRDIDRQTALTVACGPHEKQMRELIERSLNEWKGKRKLAKKK